MGLEFVAGFEINEFYALRVRPASTMSSQMCAQIARPVWC